MSHPNFPDRKPVPVTLVAFENIWEGKGWVLVNAVTVEREAAASPELVEMSRKRLEALTTTDLKKIARHHRVPYGSKASKRVIVNDILEAINPANLSVLDVSKLES